MLRRNSMKKDDRIVLYSFILTVFVVWLHAGEPLFSFVPGQIAVPGFFALSGYLFMRGLPGNSGDALGRSAESSGRYPAAVLFAASDSPRFAAELAAKQSPAAIPPDDSSATATGGISRCACSEAPCACAALSDTTPEGYRPVASQILDKMKRRVHTLVIPYLAWNTIYFVIYLAAGKATLAELPEAVLLYRCNPVFWYMFQLILITIISPVIYFIMKKGRAAALLLLAVIFALAVFYAKLPFHYCNEDALFYYCLGAYFSLRGTYGDAQRGRIAQDRSSSATGTYLPLALTVAAAAAFLLVRNLLPPALYNVSEVGCRAAGAAACWFAVSLFHDRYAERCGGTFPVQPWMQIDFFVYATHYMVIRAVWALEQAAGLNGSQTANVITYLVMPAICISAAYGLSLIMKKYVPKIYSVLTGGR